MAAYLVRRLVYGAATVLGVLFFLFVLFFLIATPEDIARKALGEKASVAALEQWVANHGYDKPRMWNPEDPADTMLVQHFRRMLTFDFGRSDADDTPIIRRLKEGIGPSLMLTVPMFVLGLLLAVGMSLFVAFFRETYIDRGGVLLTVLLMSVSMLLYIIGAQYVIAKLLRWFPISGFDPHPAIAARFLAMPVLVGVVAHIGADVRFMRTVFIEETGRDYVRTARAKGVGPAGIMTRDGSPSPTRSS